MNLQVGIDFTKSNGDINKETSLHYIGQERNQYQQVIEAVGNIL